MSAVSEGNELRIDVSYASILRLALPISFAILIPQLNFITNTIFLGHYSSQAMAVAGITGVYYLIFGAIGYGLNNGMQALISRRAGEDRPEEIGRIFRQGILVSMFIAVAGILFTYVLVPVVFPLFIKDGQRLQQAVSFLSIRIWGLPFLYLYQMRNALLVGTNQSKFLVYGTIAETGTNVLLDYVLIFGKWGFPEMGFNGAAYASIIAEFVGLIVVLAIVHYKGIGKRFSLFDSLAWDGYNLKLLLTLSAPLVFQHAISIMSWEYFFLLIDRHGEKALAISNTMRNVFGLFGCVTWALASTTNAMVSNVIGQQKKRLVWLLIGRIIRLSTGFSLIVALLLNLFPVAFLSLFGQSEGFVEDAIPTIRIVSVAMIMMSFSTVFLNTVIGSGNSRITLLIEANTIVFYCIYIYLVLDRFFLPLPIGWMSEWLYWSLMFIPSYLYLRSGKWKQKVI
jgi:putative MATE family efflux protein